MLDYFFPLNVSNLSLSFHPAPTPLHCCLVVFSLFSLSKSTRAGEERHISPCSSLRRACKDKSCFLWCESSPAEREGLCVSVCVCLCCECMRVTHHGILSLLHDLLHFIPSFHVFGSVVAASESWRLKRKEIQKHMKPFCRWRRDIFERTQ